MKKRIISLLLCLCMVFSLLPTAVLAADGEDSDASAGSGQVMQQDSEKPGDQSDSGNQEDLGDLKNSDDLNDSENSDDLKDPEDSDDLKNSENSDDLNDSENQDDLNDPENPDDSDAPQLLGEGGEGATTTAVPELEHPATEGTSGGIDWKVENGILTITPSSNPEGDCPEGQMVENYGTLTKKAPEDADYIAALTAAGYKQSEKGYFYYPGTETWVSDSPWKFLSEQITSVVVEDGVTSIAARAFRLPKVTEVSIPASVKSIGILVFEACENLTTVNWTGNWKGHAPMAFNGFSRCSSLGNEYELTDWMPACFYVNDGSDSIEGTQFTVNFDELNKRLQNDDATYPRAMFRSVPKITSATLTSQLNVDYIFEYSGIQSVTIADDQENIAIAAFRGCKGLTSVTIPASVTTIHTRAFADSGLKNITFSGPTSPKFDSFAFEHVTLDSVTLNDENMSVTEAVKIIGELTREGAITDSTTITPAKFANFNAENVVVDGAEGEAINHQSYPLVKNLTINGAYTSAIEAFGSPDWGKETLETLTIHAPGKDVTINAMAFLRTPLKSVKIEAKKLTFTGDAAFLNTMYLTHIDLTGVDEITLGAEGKRTFAIGTYHTGGFSAPTRYVYFKNAAAYTAMSSQFGGNTNTYYLVTNGGSVDATKTGFDAVYREGYTAKWYDNETCTGTPVTGNPVTGETYYVQWTDGELSGHCGAEGNEQNVRWILGPNGDGYTLSIFGTGAMADYTCNITGSKATQPWRKSETGVEPTAITKVVVGNGVTNIGNFACDGLSQVKVYDIAASVEDIGPWGVCGQNAKAYNLHDSTHYVTKDGVLMSADGKTLVSYPGGKDAVDEYVIPDTVETILDGAFVGIDAKKVVIPKSVTKFPRFSFGGSTVEEIEFNANVDKLERGAFSGLKNLNSFVFGSDTTVSIIDNEAFADLSNLTEITFPDSLTTIGDQAFKVLPGDGAAAPNLKKVTFGKGMSTIGSVVFLRQSALEVIDMTHCEQSKLTAVGEFNSRNYDDNITHPYTTTPIVYTADADVAGLVQQNNRNLIYAVTNGGTFPADTVFETGKLAKPEKDGYLFLGWYADSECKGDEVRVAEAGNIYYAKWTNDIPKPTINLIGDLKVKITCVTPDSGHAENEISLKDVDSWGGVSWTPGSDTATLNLDPKNYAKKYDTAQNLAEGTHKVVDNRLVQVPLTYTDGEWSATVVPTIEISCEYTITYVYRDKDVASKPALQPENPTTYSSGKGATLNPITSPGSFGKRFLEWRLDTDGDGEGEDAIAEIPVGMSGNLTVYAYWKYPVNYTVYDENNETITDLCVTDYVAEDAFEQYSLRLGEQTGYNFDGWYQNTNNFGNTNKRVTAPIAAKKWELVGKLTRKEYTVTASLFLNGEDMKIPKSVKGLFGDPINYDGENGLNAQLKEAALAADAANKPNLDKVDIKICLNDKSGKPFDAVTYGQEGYNWRNMQWQENKWIVAYAWAYVDTYYDVTFNSDGGSAVDPQTVKYGDKLAAFGEPTKDGYKFLGWYTEADEAFNLTTPITKSMTLTAKWERNTYTIIYHGNGGVKVDGNKTHEQLTSKKLPIGEPTTLKSAVFTRDNYEFLGWSYFENGSVYFKAAEKNVLFEESDIDENGNVHLYAIWKRLSYPVTLRYNANTTDEVANMPEPLEQTKNSDETGNAEFDISDKIPTRAGYRFLGWALNKPDAAEDDIAFKAGETSLPFVVNYQDNITLYAVWQAQYTVTYTYESSDVTHTVPYPVTEGKPEDDGKYAVGEMVRVAAKPEDVESGEYIWKFVTWKLNGDDVDPNAQVPMVEGGLTFVGIWECTQKEYGVTYSYVSADPAIALPQAVLDTRPTNEFTYTTDEWPETAAKPDDVIVGEYVWKFVTWKFNGIEVAPRTRVQMVSGGLHFEGIWQQERIHYSLTIQYVDKNDEELDESHVELLPKGGEYKVDSPKIKGYKLKNKHDAVIEGTMPGHDLTIKVVYVRKTSGGSSVQIESPNKPKQDNSLKFNTEDHFAYVNGYPDGTVKPTGDVTRAEVAAILYRVMDADCVKTYETTRCSFSDVVRGDWFNLYVATLENADVIVDTRTNGKFRPNEAITRAELAAMLAQFADIKSAANSFNDVSARHWASDEIAVCAKMGWINGYPDGSFRPDATITRAEMMAMINRALGRTPKSADDLLSGMKTWRDNANVNEWYYLDVQEATNSHTYTKSGSHESWKKLR